MKNLLLLLFLGSTICGATILDSIQQKTKCPDWTTFHTSDRLTPDNDNIDDTWRITYNLYCWEDVEFWIYNEENEEIYHDYGSSFDLYPFWDGVLNKQYIPNGEYSYVITAKKITTGEVIQKTGKFTMFKK